MLTIDRIKEKYPIHWFVWNNDFSELQQAIDKTEVSLFCLEGEPAAGILAQLVNRPGMNSPL